MAKDFVEQRFPIQCRGRDRHGNEVLKKPVAVTVVAHQHSGDFQNIHLDVECPYITGGHGQRCKASHPNTDKVGEGVGCPYSVDIPYALEIKNRRF